MKTFKLAAPAFALALMTTAPALAFDCPNSIASAEGAIAEATGLMEALPDGAARGLVHTLIDDANGLLEAARRNHGNPAAAGYDHARAVARARSAQAHAEAAAILAGAS